MKNLFCILVILLVSSTAYGAQEDFCGRVKGLYFKEFRGRIHAYGYLDQIESFTKKTPLLPKKIVVTDPKVVFKLARVISQVSIQNSAQLQADLKRTQFEWDYLVGDELHPNPYEEDFTACLKADLGQLKPDSSLQRVTEILDIREDGYSIIDLLE